MTCIVAVVEDGKITMGGDCAGSVGHQVTIANSPKVFQNGEFLFGSMGSARMRDLLHYGFTPPAQGDLETMRYLCTSFVNALRECFKDGGFLLKFNEQEWGGKFLFGYRGKLYAVDSDYQVVEFVDEYAAIGCGEEVALGVLYATHNDGVEHRIKTALEAATYHCNGVRPPFTILSMQTETVVKNLVEALA